MLVTKPKLTHVQVAIEPCTTAELRSSFELALLAASGKEDAIRLLARSHGLAVSTKSPGRAYEYPDEIHEARALIARDPTITLWAAANEVAGKSGGDALHFDRVKASVYRALKRDNQS